MPLKSDNFSANAEAAVAKEKAMRIRRVTLVSLISICVLFSLFLSAPISRGQAIESQPWGKPRDGLQMSLSTIHVDNAEAELQVTFRNQGKQDVILNLGRMLKNGEVQLPGNISLYLTDGVGNEYKLLFIDKRYPGIAGRVDDFLVPLRLGSTYTLRCKWDQFKSPEAEIAPGKYQISAEFQDYRTKPFGLKAPRTSMLNVWYGSLQSNTVSIEIAGHSLIAEQGHGPAPSKQVD